MNFEIRDKCHCGYKILCIIIGMKLDVLCGLPQR